MQNDKSLLQLAEQLGHSLQRHRLQLATAESCTGGGVAHAITAIAGSSGWFERGFVTYTNAAKQEMLAVPAMAIAQQGAVSADTVTAMVRGALAQSRADCALAVSGIAGPSGGSAAKPVGTVYFAWLASGREIHIENHLFKGDRHAVRLQAVKIALGGMLAYLDK